MRPISLYITFALMLLAVTQVFAQSGYQPSSTIHGQAEVGYFAHSDIYRYLADINLWFNFGQYKDLVFFFNGGILTYIAQNEEEGFQPKRYRGTVEPGTYAISGPNTYYFYVKHQSFHDIDFYDGLDESYEIYTLAYKRTGNPNFFISAGKFENTKDVDYDWEFLGWLEFPQIGTAGHDHFYFNGSVRHVTEADNPTGRNGFTDYTSELGFETTPGLRYFAGYRVIHDINHFDGVTDHEVVLGIRYNW